MASPPFPNWLWVWKINSSPRSRHFIWQSLHQKLRTRTLLLTRQIIPDPTCNLCGSAPETTVYVLRNCPSARIHWNSIGIPSSLTSSFDLNLENWLKLNCQSKETHNATYWSVLFPSVCWEIWKSRNSFIFTSANPIHFKPDHTTALAID
ncbi:putative ribonuclease H protein [Camellia lanceoleosa]|uniref:Ribonuclease H protein n=1 Tax=Camellia lanceoleosa TaxID=1840588 RepID=A0ACC0HX39_9ERIC|nr:putative ribonuclease H protein [Camellia lanceoleosa]